MENKSSQKAPEIEWYFAIRKPAYGKVGVASAKSLLQRLTLLQSNPPSFLLRLCFQYCETEIGNMKYGPSQGNLSLGIELRWVASTVPDVLRRFQKVKSRNFLIQKPFNF
jgi:hypothetical protein